MRFSLRTLILLVALCTSGYGLWFRWEPWAVIRVLEISGKCQIVRFSTDGQELLASNLNNNTISRWDTASWSPLEPTVGELQIAGSRYQIAGLNRKVRVKDWYFRKLLIQDEGGDVICEIEPPGNYIAYVSVSPASPVFAVGSDVGVFIYHRSRPEFWWGVFWLPEFYLAAVIAAGLLWSIVRDRRMARAV